MAAIDKPRIIITPTLLSTGYTTDRILFAPIELEVLTYDNYRPATLRQVGVFWDIASAPAITIFFFAENPAGFGNANTAPAPTFNQRASLMGEVDFTSSDYETMRGSNTLENSYGIITGNLAEFSMDTQSGWMTAVINAAHATTLVDKLKISLHVDKRG